MDLRNEGEPTIADEGGRERPRTQLTTGTEITGVRPFRKPILTAATQTCLMPHKVEDAPLKPVYTLVFVLSIFAAPAQALDASTIAAWELDECSWEVIAQSTMPAPMVASEPTIGMLEETDDAAITEPNNAEGGIAVGTMQPSEAQGTMPAQIVDDEAEDVVITGANRCRGYPGRGEAGRRRNSGEGRSDGRRRTDDRRACRGR